MDFHVSASQEFSDMTPLRNYAPDVYAALADEFDTVRQLDDGSRYPMLPDVYVQADDPLSFGAFIYEQQGSTMYHTDHNGAEGATLGILYDGQWFTGDHLCSAAHYGEREDYRDMEWDHSLLLVDETTDTGEETVGLLVDRSALAGLYVVSRGFVPTSPAGEPVPVFDPTAFPKTR
jgi:hypothetical protein